MCSTNRQGVAWDEGAITRWNVLVNAPMKPPSRSGFQELTETTRIPLTPGPSPTLGRGEPIPATVVTSQCTTLIKESNMDDDDTFYDVDQPANDEDDADDDWGAWMLDNDTAIN